MFNRMLVVVILGLSGFVYSCGDNESKRSAPSSVVQEEIPQDQQGGDAPETPAPINPEAVTPLKYPVVFHHGFMDSTNLEASTSGITAAAQNAGASKIYYTEVSPANTIEIRAKELATQIDEILAESKAEKVHILAHSFGGLDARYLISSLGYEDKVASLSTLSTPHRGTPLADTVMQESFSWLASAIDKIFGLAGNLLFRQAEGSVDTGAALENLTEEYMVEVFNPANPDSEKVVYQSWAGISGLGTGHAMKSVLLPSATILAYKQKGMTSESTEDDEDEGFFNNLLKKLLKGTSNIENDGVVPVSSAKWGNFRGTLKADHLDLSGRNVEKLGGDGFNFPKYIEFYIKDLVTQGFKEE